MGISKVTLGLATTDLTQAARDYGPDDRFVLATVQSDWNLFSQIMLKSEPELVIIHASIAPGPEALAEFLAKLKHAVAIVLLPPAQAQFQGRIENVHTVRKVWIGPVSPAEVLNFGFSAVQTERAKSASVAPMNSAYQGASSGRAAAAVGTRIIAFLSAQGGVGKTTLAESLAYELAAHRSIKTLLFAFDLPPLVVQHFPNLRYTVNAAEFFARPETGFSDAVQSTVDGLDLVAAPQTTHAYASAAQVEDPYARNSIRSLVSQPFLHHYAAILLDLPAGEGAWTLQSLLSSNMVLIVSRPTMDGIRTTAHSVELLTKSLAGQHRIPKEAIFVVLNQMNNKSSLTAASFAGEGAAYAGWFPPVLAVIEHDPLISQAQDKQQPALNASETLRRAVIAMADSFYGGERRARPVHRKKGLLGVSVTVKD